VDAAVGGSGIGEGEVQGVAGIRDVPAGEAEGGEPGGGRKIDPGGKTRIAPIGTNWGIGWDGILDWRKFLKFVSASRSRCYRVPPPDADRSGDVRVSVILVMENDFFPQSSLQWYCIGSFGGKPRFGSFRSLRRGFGDEFEDITRGPMIEMIDLGFFPQSVL